MPPEFDFRITLDEKDETSARHTVGRMFQEFPTILEIAEVKLPGVEPQVRLESKERPSPELTRERFRSLLKTTRQVYGLSVRKLSEMSGVSHAYIALLESSGVNRRSGKLINPSYRILRKLEDTLFEGLPFLSAALGVGLLPQQEELEDHPRLMLVCQMIKDRLGRNPLEF